MRCYTYYFLYFS